MPSQPVAFAELLAGGVLIVSAITNEPITQIVTAGITPGKLTSGITSTPATGVSGTVDASGGAGSTVITGTAPSPGSVGGGLAGVQIPSNQRVVGKPPPVMSFPGYTYDPASNQFIPVGG